MLDRLRSRDESCLYGNLGSTLSFCEPGQRFNRRARKSLLQTYRKWCFPWCSLRRRSVFTNVWVSRQFGQDDNNYDNTILGGGRGSYSVEVPAASFSRPHLRGLQLPYHIKSCEESERALIRPSTVAEDLCLQVAFFFFTHDFTQTPSC